MVKKGITGIYAILNMIDGKKYIGQAKDIKERNGQELSSLKGAYFTNHHLQHAFNKYGEENFIFIFLEECSEEKLNERERYHITAAGYPDHNLCYNITRGGEGTTGWKPTEETLKKMSEATSGENNPMYGKVHPNKGKTMPQCSLKGEKNGNSSLTVKKVRMIKVMLRSDIRTIKQIAKLFNVHPNTIKNIKSGANWSDVKVKGWDC
jgi:group I intron endonuclease